MIRVENLPVREAFRTVPGMSTDEQDRIIKTGLVSQALLSHARRATVAAGHQDAGQPQGRGGRQTCMHGLDLFSAITEVRDPLVITATIVPRAPGASDGIWHPMIDVVGYSPTMVQRAAPKTLPGYSSATINPVIDDTAHADGRLAKTRRRGRQRGRRSSWPRRCGRSTPQAYPSRGQAERRSDLQQAGQAERSPGSAFYFFALVCFVASANSGVGQAANVGAAVCG